MAIYGALLLYVVVGAGVLFAKVARHETRPLSGAPPAALVGQPVAVAAAAGRDRAGVAQPRRSLTDRKLRRQAPGYHEPDPGADCSTKAACRAAERGDPEEQDPVPPAKTRRAKPPLRPKGAARVIEPTSAPAAVIERPDGFYWQAPDSLQAFGPFATAPLARADRDAYDEDAPEPGETLEEAERDLGIGEWIDPDTGELAEGLSAPRLPRD